MQPPGPRRIHYTELPDSPADDPLGREMNFLRGELPRLLAEGHEGKFALVKDQQIVGLYPSDPEAMAAGRAKFGLQQFLIHQILTWEPYVILSSWCWPCRT